MRALFREDSDGSCPLARFAETAFDELPFPDGSPCELDLVRVARLVEAREDTLDRMVESLSDLSDFCVALPLARVVLAGACSSFVSGAASFCFALPLADALVFLAGASSCDCCCCPLFATLAGGAFFFAACFDATFSVLVVDDLLDLRGATAAGFWAGISIVKSTTTSSSSVVNSPSLPPRESLALRLRAGCASVTRAAVDFFAAAVADR